jgi:hypothetical protein
MLFKRKKINVVKPVIQTRKQQYCQLLIYRNDNLHDSFTSPTTDETITDDFIKFGNWFLREFKQSGLPDNYYQFEYKHGLMIFNRKDIKQVEIRFIEKEVPIND